MTRRNAPSTATRLLVAGSTLALTASAALGCSSDGDTDSTSSAGGDITPSVVASTNVYGSIAEAVAGDRAEVVSIIDSPQADPHSFEASPGDAARVSGADLVVYNGAGYDAFIEDALSNSPDVRTVVAVDEFTEVTGTTVEAHSHGGHDHGEHTEAGKTEDGHAEHAEAGKTEEGHAEHDHDHGEHAEAGKTEEGHAEHAAEPADSTDNEHVWFHLDTAMAVADAIADQLAEIDPDDAETYRANADTFVAELAPLEKRLTDLSSGHHAHYVQTEPIGQHLFDTAKFHDVTPKGFLSAIEEDSDPAAADFVATRDLVRGDEVDFLAFNTQTATEVTDRLATAARQAGKPVVELTETLPEGTDYRTWMGSQIDAVAKAVEG